MDERLQRTLRRAAQGEEVCEALLLRERLRAGQLEARTLRLAAYLGNARAAAACGAPRGPEAFAAWAAGLAAWGRPAVVRAAAALLRRALAERRSLPDEPPAPAQSALARAEAWCRGTPDAVPDRWTLEEARAAALVADGIDGQLCWLASEVLVALDAEAPDLRETLRHALRVLDEASAREAIRAALVPWALGEEGEG